MKLLKTLGLFCALTLSSVTWSSTLLADFHSQKGMNCASCHKESTPSLPVPTAQCLSCHQSYEALKEKTKLVNPNPHYTHMGDMPCNECHRLHKPSVNMCADCHKLDLKVR